MEKRSSRTALLFSIGFLFMLICAIAAFFYGIQLGTSKVESKYAAERAIKEEIKNPTPYQQQDLVSFYHTVFLPYREFQNEWYSVINKITQGQSNDVPALFKNLSNLADKKAKEAGDINVENSPLLAQAQANYISSLKAFKEASGNAASSAKSLSVNELIADVKQEKNYLSAVNYALSAQQGYYDGMLKWAASVNLDINAEFEVKEALSIKEWSPLPLTIKNKVIASQLKTMNALTSYYPHDLTSRIDLFIKAGQADKMELKTVKEVIELLISTDAVRSGDYLANKTQLYYGELLPLLPFFSTDTK